MRFLCLHDETFFLGVWCYVQLREGNPERMIDYRWRGCDAAWRLQMAIDAERRVPQRFRVRTVGSLRLRRISPSRSRFLLSIPFGNFLLAIALHFRY